MRPLQGSLPYMVVQWSVIILHTLVAIVEGTVFNVEVTATPSLTPPNSWVQLECEFNLTEQETSIVYWSDNAGDTLYVYEKDVNTTIQYGPKYVVPWESGKVRNLSIAEGKHSIMVLVTGCNRSPYTCYVWKDAIEVAQPLDIEIRRSVPAPEVTSQGVEVKEIKVVETGVYNFSCRIRDATEMHNLTMTIGINGKDENSPSTQQHTYENRSCIYSSDVRQTYDLQAKDQVLITCAVEYASGETNQTSTDVNECKAIRNPCDQVCSNTLGSYRCSCLPGYVRDNGTCIDVNECKAIRNPCDQVCNNTLGSYRCSCLPSYVRDNGTCINVNECAAIPSPCDQICTNTAGSYLCSCWPGYVRDNGKCADVNECSAVPGPCDQLCVNIAGGYRCSCLAGHVKDNEICTVPPDVAEDYQVVYGLCFELLLPLYTMDLQDHMSMAFQFLITAIIPKVDAVFATWFGSPPFSHSMIARLWASSSGGSPALTGRTRRQVPQGANGTTFIDMNLVFLYSAGITEIDIISAFLSAFQNGTIKGANGTSYKVAQDSVRVALLNPGIHSRNNFLVLMVVFGTLLVVLLIPAIILISIRIHKGKLPDICIRRFDEHQATNQTLSQHEPQQPVILLPAGHMVTQQQPTKQQPAQQPQQLYPTFSSCKPNWPHVW